MAQPGDQIFLIADQGEMLTGQMSEIILSKGDVNSATSRSFTYYDTRMGTPKVNPVDGTATYPMNGFWHGRFSEAMADTADAAKRYPTSAIGTFGVSGTLDMGTPDNTKDDVTHSLIGGLRDETGAVAPDEAGGCGAAGHNPRPSSAAAVRGDAGVATAPPQPFPRRGSPRRAFFSPAPTPPHRHEGKWRP